jgi:hypothetical protein
VQLRRLIQRRIRVAANGVSIAGDVNAAVAANTDEHGAVTAADAEDDGSRSTSNQEVDTE